MSRFLFLVRSLMQSFNLLSLSLCVWPQKEKKTISRRRNKNHPDSSLGFLAQCCSRYSCVSLIFAHSNCITLLSASLIAWIFGFIFFFHVENKFALPSRTPYGTEFHHRKKPMLRLTLIRIKYTEYIVSINIIIPVFHYPQMQRMTQLTGWGEKTNFHKW